MAEIASYKEWGCAHVINSLTNRTITVSNATKKWGKWYQFPDKDTELSDDDINSISFKPDEQVDIAASGRSDASSGCEVLFDLNDGNTKICTIYFTCPWGASYYNNVEIRNRNREYPVTLDKTNKETGSLGTFNVEVYKKG